MAKKVQLKKDMQDKFDELKREINENSRNFDEEFKKILQLIDEEKMEQNEFTELKGKDINRFIEYYRDKKAYIETTINECLHEAKYNYKKTLELMGEDEEKESND